VSPIALSGRSLVRAAVVRGLVAVSGFCVIRIDR
jgi:hypothetical protein